MGPHDNINDVYDMVEALMILHNICIEWNDKPEYIWKYDPQDEYPPDTEEEEARDDADNITQVVVGETEVPMHETDAWLKAKGLQKRREVLDELFPVGY